MQDKFRSLKLNFPLLKGSFRVVLTKNIKVLNTCLKNLTWRLIFEAEVSQ